MDRSMDSIGSCSLDVDADSSDISDTSGSLNFPTPLSVKDITREFTANIRERCALRTANTTATTVTTTTTIVPQQSTVIVDPASGHVRMVLAQLTSSTDTSALPPNSPTSAVALGSVNGGGGAGSAEKKPSYLNLACCVNGYSNLTTYDSKIRQDINKSREVSPIRPSSQSLQYCKRSNALAPPVLHAMPNVSAHTKQPLPGGHASQKYMMSHEASNGNGSIRHPHEPQVNGNGLHGGQISFIQQRVERLYGPGALAQGFYSPKKVRSPQPTPYVAATHRNEAAEAADNCELTLKFQQLSPNRDYTEFKKKLDANTTPAVVGRQSTQHVENNSIDLPCLRHLSQEFRAQLPTISPKRSAPRSSPGNIVSNGVATLATRADEVDHTVVPYAEQSEVSFVVQEPPSTKQIASAEIAPVTASHAQTQATVIAAAAAAPVSANGVAVKDGNYFLVILKNEQTRLLALACDAEKYIEALANNPDISEDTMGFLRAASGKARLLVSQKMKQFEGLCHNNLNRSPEDKFPTTVDDLQGFWDMVYLQIDHIDAIFAEIELMKHNDWKKPKAAISATNTPTKTLQNKTCKTGNPRTATKLSATNGKVGGGGGGGGGANKKATPISAAALKREAQRKQLLEMKRKNRMALAATAAETTAPDGCVNSTGTFVDETLLGS